MTTEVSPHQLDVAGFTQDRPYTLVLPCTDTAGSPVTPSSATLYVWNLLGQLVATITGTITAGRVEFDLDDITSIDIVKRTVYRAEIVLGGYSSLKGTFEFRPASDGRGTSDPRTTWPLVIAEGIVTVPVTVTIELTGADTLVTDGGGASSPASYTFDGSTPSSVPTVTLDGGTP